MYRLSMINSFVIVSAYCYHSMHLKIFGKSIQEQEAEPDDDEVEGNPAFIPKSGRYYMHDSRNTDEERTPEPSSHSRADGKWKHDRFDERSQRPKTKRELMNRYGYDIRNEVSFVTFSGTTT